MKCIICIISSDQKEYENFKKVIIESIKECSSSCFEFYFLYDKSGDLLTIQNQNYTDFYCDTMEKEVTKSIYKRTVSFYDWYFNEFHIKSNYTFHKKNGLFFLRTNLSTLFNLKILQEFLYSLPKEDFFGGPFIGPYYKTLTRISGTCHLSSFDTIWYIILNKEQPKFINDILEDEAISLFLFRNKKLYSTCIKRLDTIEMDNSVLSIDKSIVFHKCSGDDIGKIFCFRFKTFDRNFDVNQMKLMLKVNFDIRRYINASKLKVILEGSEYSKSYSNKIFQVL